MLFASRSDNIAMQLIGLLILLYRAKIYLDTEQMDLPANKMFNCCTYLKETFIGFGMLNCSLKNLNPTLVVSVLGPEGGGSRPNILTCRHDTQTSECRARFKTNLPGGTSTRLQAISGWE